MMPGFEMRWILLVHQVLLLSGTLLKLPFRWLSFPVGGL
jgi:hypothetical protein